MPPTSMTLIPRASPGPAPDPGRAGVGVAAACLVWGFAEATLFFVIPDVLLSLVATRNLRRGLVGCCLALAGALAGGTLMYAWSARDHAAAVAAVDAVPFVPSPMVTRVHGDLVRQGGWAVVAGPWTGRPYKLYAVEAAAAGMSLAAFVAVSVPARLLRFVFLAVVARLVARVTIPRWGWRTTVTIWAVVWVINYGLYWTVMSR
jgi:membrane protein YqaA with SNARE-associated domain